MDGQLRFELPVPAHSPGAMQIWVMAAEAEAVPIDRRHIFVDAGCAAAFAAPGDLVLLRQNDGVYAVLASERLGSEARIAVLDHLVGLLSSPELKARRASDVREAMQIALTPGRWRGGFVQAEESVRSRTAFEHALLQVAGRHGVDCLSDALKAVRVADRALNSMAHPVVHGIFRREHGDMLSRLFAETGEPRFARDALPAYIQAADAFAQVGLSHQTRSARQRGAAVRQAVEQPWLEGFSPPPLAPSGLGYAVGRLCGFSLSLEAPGAWYAATSGDEAAFVPIGTVVLADAAVLSILAGAPCLRRRAVAMANQVEGRVVLRAGLAGSMHAALGALGDNVDHSDVMAISIECETLAFETRPRAMRPFGPVTFAARPEGASHAVALRIAMMDDDDVVLRFNIDKLGTAPRTFI